jgi:N-acetylmuramoyl-L-alanine amidase
MIASWTMQVHASRLGRAALIGAAALAGSLTVGTELARGTVAHSVAPGESLFSIASRDGLSVSQLAAANGLSSSAQLRAGAVLQIPGRLAPATPSRLLHSTPTRLLHTTSARVHLTGEGADDGGHDGAGADGVQTGRATASAPALGAYAIRPGDTLSALALRSRVSVGQMAYMNGLDVNQPLRIGTVIKLPTGAPSPTRAGLPLPAHRVIPAAGPYPTPAHVSLGEIQTIAARHGVPPSLAAAIAWQESGFNNGLVSSANARGVMQLLPGTWDWVQRTLVGHPLNPSSPRDNVAAGVLYLRSLLHSTAGDPGTAAAAYYQGLGSVRQIGFLPDTQRYVSSVRALMSRFGGG